MFITFEGIDGSGKSTQIKKLKDKLITEGFKVEVFRDPGGTQASEKIRSILLTSDFKIHPVTELLLFSAARSQLITEEVKPLLDKNTVVILDRFYDSTIAYQGYGRASLPLEDIQRLNEIASRHLAPDLTFYLRVSLQEARRRTARKAKDRMEQSGTDFYKKVLEGFDALAQSEERIMVIDGTDDADQIHQKVWDRISQKL